MQLSSLRAAPPSPRGVAVTSIADLSFIYEPDVNLVVWVREPGTRLTQACARLALQSFDRLKLVIEPGRTGLSLISEWLMGEEEVARDLLELSEVVADLVEVGAVGARVAKTTSPMCPAFHVDRVPVRLVVSYLGPGSEWLMECDAQREALSPAHGRGRGGMQRAGAAVQKVAPFHVAVMKGEGWPNNSGRGLVHRSPATSVQRIVATLDPLR